MNSTLNIQKAEGVKSNETLNVNIKKGKISLSVTGFTFIDKDTKQYNIYIPSLDISSYGENLKKAEVMIKHSFMDFCEHLLSLNVTDINSTLSSLGWNRSKIFSKQFSKMYVDGNGDLQNFNAEDNKIERISLTAA